jgi:hypothetical protein
MTAALFVTPKACLKRPGEIVDLDQCARRTSKF